MQCRQMTVGKIADKGKSSIPLSNPYPSSPNCLILSPGIEPRLKAPKALVLPLHQERKCYLSIQLKGER